MGRRERYIWVEEEVEASLDGEWATGLFSTEGVSGEALDAALAWAQARSDYVIVRFAESEEFSAGTKPVPELPPWPPAELPEFVRRRVPSQEWLDRTENDPAIEWVGQAYLTRDEFWGMLERDPAHDRAVAEIAARSGAEGWDSESLDDCIEIFVAATRRGETSFTTYAGCGYTLHFRVAAPMRNLAVAAVEARVVVPDGWHVTCNAFPPRRY